MKIVRLSTLNLLLVAGIASLLLSTFNFQRVEAVSASDWDPGRIIDDAVFFNKDSMSVAQIQAFLNSQVPVCDTNGNKYHNGVLRKNYSSNNPAPFTCLKDYYENTDTKANNYGGKPIPAGAKSAAQIIYDAAQSNGINPQVLLVTLQKENTLITDDWPWKGQYRTAMGYGCPDGAPCDSEYFGFYNQVARAAWQLKRYTTNPDGFNYAVGDRYVLWHPNSACGGKIINIKTQGTAALYNYTPYQPNTASVNNYPGTGNSCSSYGNRNFWNFFNDWFGSTTGAGYEFIGGITGSGIIYGNESREVQLVIKNTSLETWYSDSSPTANNPTRLATKSFITTPFADIGDSRWLGGGNQVLMQEEVVEPGELATFNFRFKGTSTEIKNYTTQFTVIISGEKTYRDIGMKFTTSSPAASYNFEQVSIQRPPNQFKPGQLWEVIVKLKNTGTVIWRNENYSNPVRLTTKGYVKTPYAVLEKDDSWLAPHTISMDSEIVRPGEIAEFRFVMMAPYENISFSHNFIPVMSGISTLNGELSTITIATPTPRLEYKVVNQPPRATVEGGGAFEIAFALKNTGNTVWRGTPIKSDKKGEFRLITANPSYKESLFYNTDDHQWNASKRFISFTGATIHPGETINILVTGSVPSEPGLYSEELQLGLVQIGYFSGEKILVEAGVD